MDELDSLQIGKSLELFPEQVKSTFKAAMSFKLPRFEPKAIVISGMGGSSNAAKILEGIYEEDFKLPLDIDIHNDYDLPSWINHETLVILNSYSGNTEETLSALDDAKKAGAMILGVTTGGKIKDMIDSREISGVYVDGKTVNPSDFPKAGLGISFGALAGVLTNIGVLKIDENELNTSLEELAAIRKNWDALVIAKELNGFVPILLTGRPLLGSLNAGRNAMCEISRNFTQFYDFPEVNHVLIEATQKPDFIKDKFKYVFFESQFHHARVKLRFEITKKIFSEQGIKYLSHNLQGSTKLAQALELPHYCAWVGYHLSLLQNTDPGPEPWIIELKNSLSQPIH